VSLITLFNRKLYQPPDELEAGQRWLVKFPSGWVGSVVVREYAKKAGYVRVMGVWDRVDKLQWLEQLDKEEQ
jgi:hypothetical protein